MSEGQTNLIVNYLPQTLTDEEFRSMFLSIGPIKSCKIVRDRATGYSYGFGFVEYENGQDASRAIHTLNGLQLQNKTIKVAYSRSGDDIKGANLYVRNIPKTMSAEELQEIFEQYGQIVQVRILKDQVGQSRGVGFVLFNKKTEADEAIASLNGHILPGGQDCLNVKYAEDNKGKARPPVVVVAKRGGYAYGQNYGGGPGDYGGGPGPMRNQGGRGYRYNPVGGGMGGGNYSQQMSMGGDGNTNSEGYVLFVYNIGTDADERALWQLFSPFGKVQKVNVMRDFQKNQCKGFGFVTMTNYHEASSAILGLNGYRYAGKPLQVSFKTPKL